LYRYGLIDERELKRIAKEEAKRILKELEENEKERLKYIG